MTEKIKKNFENKVERSTIDIKKLRFFHNEFKIIFLVFLIN